YLCHRRGTLIVDGKASGTRDSNAPGQGEGKNHGRAVRRFAARGVAGYIRPMRIATWNVNSLKARLEKVVWWLDRAKPDVLLMQETKLADADTPIGVFAEAGYALVHHGEGRWNGVAIASRCGIDTVVTNFGQPLRHAKTADVGDDEPLAEARMLA